MSAATNVLPTPPAASFAWADVVRDVRAGALATARLIVTSAGTLTLLLGAVLVAHDDVRDSLWSALKAPVVAAAPSATEPAAPMAAAEGATTATPVPVNADPRQKHVVQYLSRRYRVAEEATRMLVSAAFQIGQESNLDPLLILAVVAIESSLNPFAESSMGAQGLMQVMTRVHAPRFEPHGGQLAALDPIANMKVGSAILADLISRGGSVERGLQLYVGAGNLPDDGGYGARVLNERARLSLAATGKVDAAIAAGRAATASAESRPAAPAGVTAPPAPSASDVVPIGTVHANGAVSGRAA
jgi:soluble lytic murein transglycosylase-like protein